MVGWTGVLTVNGVMTFSSNKKPKTTPTPPSPLKGEEKVGAAWALGEQPLAAKGDWKSVLLRFSSRHTFYTTQRNRNESSAPLALHLDASADHTGDELSAHTTNLF